MKTYEKIITILISMALFVCLYLTGLSAMRTASRYLLQHYSQKAVQSSKDTRRAFSKEGMCGRHLRWAFRDGILTISGEGRMKDYKASNAPWAALTVTTARVNEGVTKIGSHAFHCNKSIKQVLLPSTLTTVAADAFDRAESLPRIYVARNNACFASVSGVLFYRNGLHPVIRPFGKQRRVFSPFPNAMQQIISCIVYFLLYIKTAC